MQVCAAHGLAVDVTDVTVCIELDRVNCVAERATPLCIAACSLLKRLLSVFLRKHWVPRLGFKARRAGRIVPAVPDARLGGQPNTVTR